MMFNFPGLVFYYVLIFCLISLEVCAQETDDKFDIEIITDRPDLSEAPQLTPRGWLQAETGFMSEFDEDKQTGIREQNLLYNTTLWKYGLSKNFELRLITEYAEERRWYPVGDHLSDSMSVTSGLYPVKIGSKIFITKDRGILPNISLISHLSIPNSGVPEFAHNFLLPEFRFVFSHHPSKYLWISYNLGAEWEEHTHAATYIYTAALEFIINKKLSFYAESYGFLTEHELPDHRVDGGLLYLITHDLQFDCSAGVGLMDYSPDYFISAGLSYRVNLFDQTRKK